MLLLGSILHFFFGSAMFVMAVFLILLVLIQRGRGGGLAGAFGGMGGQSAFGAKAGDLFTRVTMAAAGIWIVLCMSAIKVLNSPSSKFDSVPGWSAGEPVQPGSPGETGTGGGPGESDAGGDAGGAPASAAGEDAP